MTLASNRDKLSEEEKQQKEEQRKSEAEQKEDRHMTLQIERLTIKLCYKQNN